MPPGSAKKGTKSTKKKRTTGMTAVGPKKSFRCKRCDRAIRLPDGWTLGPAVRRHYWAKHRSVMQPEVGRDR